MLISEIFHSPQGEGKWIGVPSIFIRTSGCNLRCWFCDTPYTSWNPEGEKMSVDQILEHIKQYDCEHVVVTGGEPMLSHEIESLTQRLHADDKIITIETAGTILSDVHADLMSISPKLSNSTPVDNPEWAHRHDARRDQPTVIHELIKRHPYQIKFVVDHREDLSEIEDYLKRYPEINRENVYLMPQGTTAEMLAERMPWLEEIAKQLGCQVTRRMHIELWGNVRGK
ncbi:7-carboxy-7-deazaguanine synthase QueE [Gimesia chilikensis]|uniref:7-carboxy-7-deazaguanine synthase QueE n=1 Tax=Gimesia chilikensis TaxID=2605989 RepID=UPI0011EF14DC|nr:7-carboxy-7-deazaguanine synthase QueE [Gimesia chilikensis]KAA0135379.1 7-carboxy-7-deazaguanine synthase QueE [Gimesia chilikensis]